MTLPLPLSKSMAPADYTALAQEVTFVETYGGPALAAQHPHRRWEYAMAIRAFKTWAVAQGPTVAAEPTPWLAVDVGGAGSPLVDLLHRGLVQAAICDPTLNHAVEDAPYADGLFHAVFAVSVIEHVPAVPAFLRACTRILAPGGLLFLTTDYWDSDGPDVAHYHWLRERLYNRHTWDKVYKTLKDQGCTRFGAVDWTYGGDIVPLGYTFASLCVTKDPEARP